MKNLDPSGPITPPQTKEQLKELLVRAAALEHVLLSAYLFTSYSLKQDLSEGGFSPGHQGHIELGVSLQWSGLITGVAVQEMLHLGLACNMVSAIGFDPEFRREELNFPITPQQMEENFGYGGNAYLGLWPFSKETIERYAWFEDYDHVTDSFPGRPWRNVASMRGDEKNKKPVLLKGLEEMNISSLVELYKAIAEGFVNLHDKGIFSGDEGKQVTDLEVTGLFNYPPAIGTGPDDKIPLLTPVTDLKSALIAVNTIIVQGEGESDDWKEFMTNLCQENGLNYNSFPNIMSAPHHEVFDVILNGGTLKGSDREIQGIKQFPNWQNFVRNIPDNPLDESSCGGNRYCEAHVHIIENEFTRQVVGLLNNLYSTMIDLLVTGFALDSDSPALEPDQTKEDYYKVKTYEKTTLIQASIRSMVYLMAPLANALTQLPASNDPSSSLAAGPGFVYSEPQARPNWKQLSADLRDLAGQAYELGRHPSAEAFEVWVRPSYYDVPTGDHIYPRYSMKKLLIGALASDLLFLSDRLQFVEGNAPRKDRKGRAYPQHVCYGLNACRGQDITGTAPAAGAGKCATADPHVCSGQNHCKGQGGCGFSPQGLSPEGIELQNHPGENQTSGRVKQANGYWTDNPHSDSACGSPIMPSIKNTYGLNNPLEKRGGDARLHGITKGYVWEFARILFEEKNPDAAPSDYIERYRKPFNTDNNLA